MLSEFRADLHIHTCLSPCGDLKMTPMRIVNEAVTNKIDLIAICDHNTTENSIAVIDASKDTGVNVLPGMEISTKEEVHIIALFGSVDAAHKMQTIVYDNLEGENDEKIFGMQLMVNAVGEVLEFNKKLLIGATNLSIEMVVDLIHSLSGIAIAAHIDREGFGIIGQLGFIPPDLRLDALEISPRLKIEEARERFLEYQRFPFLCSSDAHYPGDIGKGVTTFLLEEATFEEIRMALKGMDGRGLWK